jgi:hypothetical protein
MCKPITSSDKLVLIVQQSIPRRRAYQTRVFFFWLSEGVGGLGNILGLSAGLFHMANAADIGNTPDITTPFFCFELLL